MGINLKQGQVVIIQGKAYTVQGMIDFMEDTWEWQKYMIQDTSYYTSWLCVEENEGVTTYTIYNDFPGNLNPNCMEQDINGQRYTLHEKGKAVVKNYYGQVDVDKYESRNYVEYINEQRNSIVSIESWEGETEYSIGMVLMPQDVNVTDVMNKTKTCDNMDLYGTKSGKYLPVFLTIIFFVVPLLGGIYSVAGIGVNKPMTKYMDKSNNFTYVNSVTDNTSNKKARVYSTDLDLDSAVRNIIDGVPEEIKKTVQNKEDGANGVGLFTKNEYAYVYVSEDNQVLVQVFKLAYVNDSDQFINRK